MRNFVPSHRYWVLLAAFLIAITVFMPATSGYGPGQRSFYAGPLPATVGAGAGPDPECERDLFSLRHLQPSGESGGADGPDGTWLSQNTGSQMWIQGYADIRGDIFYNLVLSYRRAQHVKAALVKSGRRRVAHWLCDGLGQALSGVQRQRMRACYQQQRRVDIVPPDTHVKDACAGVARS